MNVILGPNVALGPDPTYTKIQELARPNASFSCRRLNEDDGQIQVTSFLHNFDIVDSRALLTSSQANNVTCGCNGHNTFTLIGSPEAVAQAIQIAQKK